MRLIYKQDQPLCGKKAGDQVEVDDIVTCGKDTYRVEYFAKPRSPASSGKITVSAAASDKTVYGRQMEYYVGVIGAEWIEREDR